MGFLISLSETEAAEEELRKYQAFNWLQIHEKIFLFGFYLFMSVALEHRPIEVKMIFFAVFPACRPQPKKRTFFRVFSVEKS